MPELLAALDAFLQEHRRCGELDETDDEAEAREREAGRGRAGRRGRRASRGAAGDWTKVHYRPIARCQKLTSGGTCP